MSSAPNLTIRTPNALKNKSVLEKAVSGVANTVGKIGNVALTAVTRSAAFDPAPVVNCVGACCGAASNSGCTIMGGKRKSRDKKRRGHCASRKRRATRRSKN